jgi:cytochrome c5
VLGGATVRTNAGPAQQPAKGLGWDATQKTVSPKPEDPTAEFVFTATNISDAPIVITGATGSCGCTTAKLPARPWVLGPHEGGQMHVSIDLAITGRMGTFTKMVTVFPSNALPQMFMVTVNLPDSPDLVRARNQMAATTDRQAVFKGDCTKCHVTPAIGKSGRELYDAACGICHDSTHRASFVPSLYTLNHPTDYNFWKQWTSEGKPAFSSKQGGPLTDEQIESLARDLVNIFPSGVFLSAPTVTNTNAIPPMPMPARPLGSLPGK